MARARWFSPVALILVIAGGALGVAARAALTLPIGADAHPLVVPAVTLAINVAGSLLLGAVVGCLGDRHPRARAFFGTGVLGGFTTYSAFAVQAVTLSSTSPFVGLALAAVSLFAGVLAAAFGLAAGTRAAGARATGTPGAPDAIRPEDAE